ncbi:hypothetical protein CEW92_14865 [Bacillaceae bacterium SAS-127]|nr:hypothetical protein CEW92_14865 [Bacillaceae bacterium SAS-127]
MKIRYIEIKNYKAVKSFEMDNIADFVVIAGPNGVGKSTIFEAIKDFERAVRKIQVPLSAGRDLESLSVDYLKTESGENKGSIKIGIELTNKEKEFLETQTGYLQGYIELDNLHNCTFDEELGRLLTTGSTLTGINYFHANRRFGGQDNNDINLNAMTRDLDQGDSRATYRRRRINEDNKFARIKDYLVAIYLDDLLLYSEESRIGTEMEDLKRVLNSYLEPKEFLGVRRDKQGLSFQVKYGDDIHDLDDLSSGEKEILMLFVNLKWLQTESYILLYDEPELHLNAKMERLIIRHLKELQGNNQIWLTTHSYEILDSSEFDEIVQVKHYTGDNQAVKLTNKEEKVQTFEVLGASIGLQLISEKVIYVEGKDDKFFFQALFRSYPESLSFVPTTGIKNLMGINQAVIDLLAEASKESEFYLIRDRDFLSDEDVEKYKREMNNKVFTLDRYHIENYLLNGELINHVLKERLNIQKFANPVEIETELKKIADALKDEVITQWISYDLYKQIRTVNFKVGGENLKTVLLARTNAQRERINRMLEEDNINSLISEKEQYIESNWDTIWKNLCPGKSILARFANSHVNMKEDYFTNLLIKDAIDLNIPEIVELRNNIAEELGIKNT